MHFQNKAYWWEIGDDLKPAMELNTFPDSTDFVVVGAGYAGLSAALTIARQGQSVVVIDSGMPGFGASTRNGGICSGQIRPSIRNLKAKFGAAYAEAVYSEGVDARHDLIKFCEDEKIDCQLQMTGRFTGAMGKSDYENQCREVDHLNEITGHKAYMVSKKDQKNEINTNLFYGGMVREEIGGFHPGKFFSGLLQAAEKAGVLVSFNNKVTEILDRKPSGKCVVTSIGRVKTGKVIIATNAYTGRNYDFTKFLRQRLIPTQSCIIVTEKLGVHEVKRLMPKLRMHGNTENLYSYFRPTPDQDRILLGSRSFDRHEPSRRSVIYLKKKLVNIFPELGACKIDYCWLGNVCFTRSQLPSVFEYDNIYYAAGFAGSGTVWARWLGKKAAELALGISNQPSMFYGAPPAKLPFYDGSPWFLPLIHRYYASKDWLKSHKKKASAG